MPATDAPVSLSVRRLNETTFTFYVDGRRLADSVYLFPQGRPLTLVLTASGRDVVVRVTNFSIDAGPRGELP